MDVEKDLDKIKEGFLGEQIVRDYLIAQDDCFFGQLDMIANIKKQWYSIEVKHQEMFTSPPFDGHGLPVWQVKTRMQLHKDTGVIPLFFVLDKQTKVLMYNSLINLEKGRKFKTGKKSRVVYPIENFITITL